MGVMYSSVRYICGMQKVVREKGIELSDKDWIG